MNGSKTHAMGIPEEEKRLGQKQHYETAWKLCKTEKSHLASDLSSSVNLKRNSKSCLTKINKNKNNKAAMWTNASQTSPPSGQQALYHGHQPCLVCLSSPVTSHSIQLSTSTMTLLFPFLQQIQTHVWPQPSLCAALLLRNMLPHVFTGPTSHTLEVIPELPNSWDPFPSLSLSHHTI